MIYSHFFNAIANFIFFYGGIGLYIWGFVKLGLFSSKIFYISTIPFGFALLILTIRIGWPIGNFLYLLFCRKTSVSFTQATELIYILCPVGKNLEWHPLKELNEISKSERVDYIYCFVINAVNKGEIILPENKVRCWILGVDKLKKRLNL